MRAFSLDDESQKIKNYNLTLSLNRKISQTAAFWKPSLLDCFVFCIFLSRRYSMENCFGLCNTENTEIEREPKPIILNERSRFFLEAVSIQWLIYNLVVVLMSIKTIKRCAVDRTVAINQIEGTLPQLSCRPIRSRFRIILSIQTLLDFGINVSIYQHRMEKGIFSEKYTNKKQPRNLLKIFLLTAKKKLLFNWIL